MIDDSDYSDDSDASEDSDDLEALRPCRRSVGDPDDDDEAPEARLRLRGRSGGSRWRASGTDV